MKYLIPLVASVCIMASCTEADAIKEAFESAPEQVVQSPSRSVNDAISIALNARIDFGLVKSRKTDNVASVVAIPTISSRSVYSDTSIYVVNFEDDGFAIVSSNPKSIGLLAITEDGRINSIDDIDNPGLKQFVQAASRYIPEDSVMGYEEYTVETVDTLDFAQVAARISTKWGQRWPAGYFCSNGICGCVALALAQTLGYFEMPSSITYTYPNKDISSETLNWQIIKNIVQSVNKPSCYFNPAYYGIEYLSLARICREIGYRLDAEYLADGTSAFTKDIIKILPSLTTNLKSSEVRNYNPNPERDLGEGIIIMRGEGKEGGHSWILDGWKRWTVHYKGYVMRTNGLISIKDHEWDFTQDVTYSHYNWGWNGSGNGYYYKDVFDSSKPCELDNGMTNANNGSYGKDVYYIVIDIK